MQDLDRLFSVHCPVLLIGAPGVGKTAKVVSAYDHAEVLLVSAMVEEDIGGLPYHKDSLEFRTEPPFFKRLREASGKRTVLFLDELDKARRSVADTLLTLIASRRMGEWSLPNDTHIVAAANPPEFGGGDGISPAMLNRFSVVQFTPSPREWAAWARDTYHSEPAHLVIDAVDKGEIGLIDQTGDGLAMRMTSPRSLSMALHYIDTHGPCKEAYEIAAGLLTANTASLVMHYAQNKNNVQAANAVKVKSNALKKLKRKPMIISN